MKVYTKSALSAVLLLMYSNGYASHNCVGRVKGVDIQSPSFVHANVEGVGNGNRLCSLDERLGEYTPEACKAIVSMLLAAKMSDKKIRLYFRNDTSTNCNKGDWQNLGSADHQLYYVRLED